MIASRRHRFRIAVLAMAALLWAQLAFALHPGCVPAVGSPPESGSSAVALAHCDHDTDSASEVVCQGHCGQGDASSDVARVPPVPPLPGLSATPGFALEVTPASSIDAHACARSVAACSRGPTGHPAKILLI